MIEIVTHLGLACVQTWNTHVLTRFVLRIHLTPKLVMGDAACLCDLATLLQDQLELW